MVSGTVVGFDGNTHSNISTTFVIFDSPQVGLKYKSHSLFATNLNAIPTSGKTSTTYLREKSPVASRFSIESLGDRLSQV